MAGIRECTVDDVPMLSETIRRSFRDVADRFGLDEKNCPHHPSNCTEAWVRQDMERGVRYFALEVEDIPCGCFAFEQVDPETCCLERLAVLPGKRRRGFGRALVDRAFLEARRLGARCVQIGIIAEQAELKNWYRGIGFTEGESREFPHLPFGVTFMSRKPD